MSDEYFADALIEFKYQWKEYGYYDSDIDSGWECRSYETKRVDWVHEGRWQPCRGDYVPSSLWDRGTPTMAGFR